MNSTCSGEALRDPEVVATPETLSDEAVILQWVIDGFLEEDAVVYAEIVHRVLEELHRRHVDETDFELSTKTIGRYTLLASRSYDVATVRLEAIGEQPAVAEVATVASEVQVDSPLVSRIRHYISTGDNLSEELWKEVELPANRDEIVALCEGLNLVTKDDPTALRRLELVASTIKHTLSRKESKPVVFIRDGNMRGSRA